MTIEKLLYLLLLREREGGGGVCKNVPPPSQWAEPVFCHAGDL